MPNQVRLLPLAVIPIVALTLLFLMAPWSIDPHSQIIAEVAVQKEIAVMQAPEEQYVGDLGELRARGEIRIIVPDNSVTGGVSEGEKKLLTQYLQIEGLRPVWIPIAKQDQMLIALQEGRGDVIAGINQSFRDVSASEALFSLPWGIARQQIVGRIGNANIRSLEDLAVRQVALQRNSPAWPLIEELARSHPGMDLLEIPAHIPTDMILDRVSSGQYDLSILNNMDLQGHLSAYPNLKVKFALADDETMRWAVRQDAPELMSSINQYLNKKHLQLDVARVYREDLPGLEKRKLLRLITYSSPVNYYFDRGRLKGFEYDLIKRFATERQMRVDVVIASSQREMQALLREGKGDVIAASLPEKNYSNLKDTKTTGPYSFSSPVLVGRTNDTLLLDPRDLQGRQIWLPQESPYLPVLQRFQQEGVELDIRVAGKGVNTEAVLFRVAQGLYDLTVIGSHELKAEFSRQINLKTHFTLTDPQPNVWAVRETDRLLLSALNEFINKEYRKGFYNVVYNRYITRPSPLKASSSLLARVEQLSPFDEIVLKYAEHHDFDWRLIVAQMYQESRFNPNALSWAGAEGLMQLLPGTAEMVGTVDMVDPDNSIRGGIRYLNYLRGLFEEDLQLEDRTWFTLAAYNAGYTRVKRARKLAEKMGLNKNRWFDNVEKAMLSLSRPYWKDGELARYCRCGQTVVYVREIKTLYNNYVRLTQSLKTAETTLLPKTAG